jgi:endonuclease-3
MTTQHEIEKIFQIFSAANPLPKTELEYTNNFTLAVAVILSAQATDISVNKATKKFFKQFNTPQKILSLGVDNLKTHIKTIGLYNSKAKNIIALCEILIDKYNSIIPDEFEELIKLPGIGRKTANVILNCAFAKPTMAVDTHVFRVAHRIGLSVGSSPEKVENDLLKKIPSKWLFYAHHWLILHGRYVCKARTPICVKCNISSYCSYYKKRN